MTFEQGFTTASGVTLVGAIAFGIYKASPYLLKAFNWTWGVIKAHPILSILGLLVFIAYWVTFH